VVTEDYLDTLGLQNDPGLLGTVTAIYDIGCFFGALLAFVIGDPLGRKNSVLVGTTIMSVGAILQISAFSVPQMIVGRYADTLPLQVTSANSLRASSQVSATASTQQPPRSGKARLPKPAGVASSSLSR